VLQALFNREHFKLLLYELVELVGSISFSSSVSSRAAARRIDQRLGVLGRLLLCKRDLSFLLSYAVSSNVFVYPHRS
jgi:hypothetical protein